MSHGEAITMLNGRRNMISVIRVVCDVPLAPPNELMKKEDIRGICDGSAFYTLEKSQDRAKNKRK